MPIFIRCLRQPNSVHSLWFLFKFPTELFIRGVRAFASMQVVFFPLVKNKWNDFFPIFQLVDWRKMRFFHTTFNLTRLLLLLSSVIAVFFSLLHSFTDHTMTIVFFCCCLVVFSVCHSRYSIIRFFLFNSFFLLFLSNNVLMTVHFDNNCRGIRRAHLSSLFRTHKPAPLTTR